MAKKKEIRLVCDCCGRRAMFEVAESKACGSHLAYLVRYHAAMPPREVTVRVIEDE